MNWARKNEATSARNAASSFQPESLASSVAPHFLVNELTALAIRTIMATSKRQPDNPYPSKVVAELSSSKAKIGGKGDKKMPIQTILAWIATCRQCFSIDQMSRKGRPMSSGDYSSLPPSASCPPGKPSPTRWLAASGLTQVSGAQSRRARPISSICAQQGSVDLEMAISLYRPISSPSGNGQKV